MTARYGDPHVLLEASNETIELLLRHRSVRRFLDEPVSDAQLTAMVAAAQSSPTSSNLQVTSVVAVRDPERKARLASLTRNAFIDQAPLFLVWIADLSRARRLADRAGVSVDATDYLETMLIGFVDTALAVQGAITAAESLGLGTCCVGGVSNAPVEIADELGLPDGAFPVVGLAVGVPDPDEAAGVKPRLPQSAVLHRESYDADDAGRIAEYDERAAAYNRSFGLEGGWTDRVLTRLAGVRSMVGREAMREWLEKRGLPSR